MRSENRRKARESLEAEAAALGIPNLRTISRFQGVPTSRRAVDPNSRIPDPDRMSAEQLAALGGKCIDLSGFTEVFWPVVEPNRPFVHGWHIGCIQEHLTDVADIEKGSIRNLIINIPPRCAKSIITCVFWFAWVWRTRPWTRWMFSSFADTLVRRDSVKCRDIIRTRLYQALAPNVRIKADQDTQLRYTNTAQGFRLAVTVAGQGMGEGADFLVVDDPINPKKAASQTERLNCIHWWRGTMSRRAEDERTVRKVIIMQRLHEEDLTGYLMAENTGWDHLVLPMRYESRRYFLPDTDTAAGGVEAKGSDGASADPPPPVPEFDPNDLAASARRLAEAVEAVAAKPRDAIIPTILQRTRPELLDGPEGSGRSEDGDLLWPERFPPKTVEIAEAELRDEAAGQYQQRPTSESGDIFRAEYFRRYERFWEQVENKDTGVLESVFAGVKLYGPDLEQVRTFRAEDLTFFQVIDTALTEKKRSAFTAVATCFATPEFDLGVWHVFRAKIEVPKQYAVLQMLRGGPVFWNRKTRQVSPVGTWPKLVAFQAIEPKASGIGLIQQAAGDGRPFHQLKVDGDKVKRAAPVASLYGAGKVYHPAASLGWVQVLEDELLTFPNGTYKDQADVLAYAGYLIGHDKILRGLCGSRVMAHTPGEDEEAGFWNRPDGDIPPDGNVFKIDVGGREFEVEFPEDERDIFEQFFGGRR